MHSSLPLSFASAGEIGTVCLDARITLRGRPDDRWIEPIVRACEEVQAMPDPDATSSVRLVPSGKDLIVAVELGDGRSALRRVKDPAQLTTTLEALLTLPPPAPAPRAPVVSEPGEMPSFAPERARAAPPYHVAFELGAAIGGRIAGTESYASVALGGHAGLLVSAWMLGVNVRWDVVQWKRDVGAREFEMDTLGAGIFAGRRLRAKVGTLDLGLASRVLVESQSFQEVSGVEHANAQTDLRLGAFARAALGASSLRPFVEVDGELSPGRLRRDIRIDPALPALPAWSAGVAFGVSWGQP